jgi:hypothetical protein
VEMPRPFSSSRVSTGGSVKSGRHAQRCNAGPENSQQQLRPFCELHFDTLYRISTCSHLVRCIVRIRWRWKRVLRGERGIPVWELAAVRCNGPALVMSPRLSRK